MGLRQPGWDLTCVAHQRYGIQAKERHQQRSDDQGNQHGKGTQPTAFQPDDDSQCRQAHQQRRQVYLPEMQHQIDRLKNLVAPCPGGCAAVRTDVAKLAEHDQQRHAAEKASHYRVRHKAREKAQAQQASCYLKKADHERHRDQGLDLLLTLVSGQCVANGDAHGAGRDHTHEGRAGEKRGNGRADHEAIQAIEWAYPGQYAGSHGIRDRRYGGRQSGDQVRHHS